MTLDAQDSRYDERPVQAYYSGHVWIDQAS